MKILEFKNIVRKDVPIYYRRLYSCIAVLEMVRNSIEVDLDFQIEHKPTGQTEISITSMGEVDYPKVPLQKEIKDFIENLETNGKLPV